jgi:hypothetical protein
MALDFSLIHIEPFCVAHPFHLKHDQIMPFHRRFCETLFRASLHLLVIVIPFNAMAIPVITQELSRSSTPATAPAANTVSSALSSKEVIDIVIPLRE